MKVILTKIRQSRTYLLVGMSVLALMFTVAMGSVGASSHTQKAVDPPDFLNVAPGNHPNLAADGLSAKLNARYACASANGYVEGSASLNVVIAQTVGGFTRTLTGTFPAQCDGLIHNFPGQGFVVTGAFPLHVGAAKIIGAIQQQEIGVLSLGSNRNDNDTESNTLTDAPKSVTLV